MSLDHARFREVYSEYLGPIRAYLARRVPFGEVEDLTADVFAVAWKKNSAVTPGEELPWLYRIASYVVANYRRRAQRPRDSLWLFWETDTAPAADAFLDADPELATAWAKLTPAQRELLALVVIDGVSVQDAAVTLGITPNALSIRLHRAKKLLADGVLARRGERLVSDET
jgi:RNA polymerase sigma-70 factor (ECF subfamily)